MISTQMVGDISTANLTLTDLQIATRSSAVGGPYTDFSDILQLMKSTTSWLDLEFLYKRSAIAINHTVQVTILLTKFHHKQER
jgi:hypothetical protein